MQKKDSWIKIHRGLKDSKIWFYTPAQFKVFMTILMEANWGEGWGRFNREEVKIKPGQMLTSRQHLSDVSGIGKNTVRKTLIKLEQDNVIRLERNSTGSRITVLNWGKYQQTNNGGNSEGYNEGDSEEGSEGYNEGDTKEEEVEEVEEVEEKDNSNNGKSEDLPPPQPSSFRDYWNEKAEGKDVKETEDGKNDLGIVKMSSKRKEKLRVRRKEEVFSDNWKKIIDGCFNSDFLIENRANGSGEYSFFDVNWVIKNDDNYLKVLEGKYDKGGNDNGGGNGSSGRGSDNLYEYEGIEEETPRMRKNRETIENL